VVVIGRNEGDRLVRCLESLRGEARRIVYVDSNSSDASVAKARVSGASVVELDPAIPFTAARARNAGFELLISEKPDLELVQFVDGDCEIRSGWLEYAAECLDERPELAVACGRRRERFPERSPYNRIADIEWDTPVGDAASCGGDALMRVRAFREAGGFDPGLIAGEEPELCLRLCRAGYKVARIPCEMTLHDAAMYRFSQFWRRAVRAGHAYAEAAYLHGREPERFGVRPLVSSAVWGAGPPLLALLLLPIFGSGALFALAAWSLLFARVYRDTRRRGHASRTSAIYAAACTVGKLAELQGALQFAWNRGVRRRATRLIEYKSADTRA